MSSSTILLYTLLLFWLLPAVTLILVYCCDRLWTAVHVRVLNALAGRRSVVAACSAAQARAMRGESTGCVPCTVIGSQLRVPLVIEDEAGNLHMRHWQICLN